MEYKTFIVDEQTAMMYVYFYNGTWKIMSRIQLVDGRWMIECSKYD